MAVFQKTNFESGSVILCLIIIFLFVSIGKTALIEVNPSRQIQPQITEQPYKKYIDILNIGRQPTFSETQNTWDFTKSQDEWQESIATQRREDEQRRLERERELLTQYSSDTNVAKKNTKDFPVAAYIIPAIIIGIGMITSLCVILCRNRSRSEGRVYQPAVGEINPYPVQQITIGSYAGPGQTPIHPPHPYYSCYPGQPYVQIPQQQQSVYPGQPQVQIPQYQPNFNLAQNSDQNTVETPQSQFPSAFNETEPYGFPVDKPKSKKIPGPTD